MYRKFVNARSPLRLLEKGLHGGLGAGNLGVVIAGHGVGKTSVLVGVALDELLRSGRVLHVCLDDTVAHVRAYYDTVFEDLAATTHLENEAEVHAEVDRLRNIRVYPPNALTASKLASRSMSTGRVGYRVTDSSNARTVSYRNPRKGATRRIVASTESAGPGRTLTVYAGTLSAITRPFRS